MFIHRNPLLEPSRIKPHPWRHSSAARLAGMGRQAPLGQVVNRLARLVNSGGIPGQLYWPRVFSSLAIRTDLNAFAGGPGHTIDAQMLGRVGTVIMWMCGAR